MSPAVMGLIICAAGVFSLLGGALDWEWFMTNRKARPLVAILGRTGARIFYGLLGIALAIVGGLLALGLIGASP
ncbi:MAG: immunity 17 family protein [Planctomycetota bacterium]